MTRLCREQMEVQIVCSPWVWFRFAVSAGAGTQGTTRLGLSARRTRASGSIVLLTTDHIPAPPTSQSVLGMPGNISPAAPVMRGPRPALSNAKPRTRPTVRPTPSRTPGGSSLRVDASAFTPSTSRSSSSLTLHLDAPEFTPGSPYASAATPLSGSLRRDAKEFVPAFLAAASPP